MKHFHDKKNGVLYAFEADGSQDSYINPEWVAVTDAEAEAIRLDIASKNFPRQDAIRTRLAEIDTMSVRPARAISLEIAKGGAPDAGDLARLADLEAEADALRTELAGLPQ